MNASAATNWFAGRSDDELLAAECFKSLSSFVKTSWPMIDPAPLLWGRHMEVICNHLQAVTEGQISNLIINIPPGHAKSMLVSVMWPAWTWARQPSWKAMFASHEMTLVTRDMDKRRDLMRSPWYTRWFRDAQASPFKIDGWDFTDSQDTKTFYKNTKLGEFQAISVGQGTGRRGDCLVIDDPINADAAHSDVKRKAAIRWKTETMASRFNDLEKAQQVIIMQRLHYEDLTGYLLKSEPGVWEHLCLMSEFEPERRCTTKTKAGRFFFTDWRTTKGELLFPEKFPLAALHGPQGKKGMGSYGYAGQHQQDPVPAGGGIIKREYFNQRWHLPSQTPLPGMEAVLHKLPPQFDGYYMFTDAAFKDTATSDRVAIGLFGLSGANLYMLDLIWDQLSFVNTVQAIIDLRKKWTRPPHIVVNGVFVEDKANGTAVMNVLKDKVPGLVPVEPDGGKEARIIAATPALEAGNVIFPLEAPWMSDFVIEACAFPKAANDDGIDMLAYAVRRLLGEFSQALLDALATP